jgi:hypothetical protein
LRAVLSVEWLINQTLGQQAQAEGQRHFSADQAQFTLQRLNQQRNR